MFMKKFKMSLPFVALAIGIAMSAFTSKPFASQWRFIGSTTSQVNTAGEYDQNVSSANCSLGSLPCIISVPHISGNTDQQDLDAYLASTSEADVVANADQTRN
jgi:hypothetical protein